MLKRNFFINVFFIFSLFSCHQDPLKDIPDNLKEGTLWTGSQHLPFFENALYEKLVKLNIKDQSENVITFQEEEKRSYTILIRPLYNLESRYEIYIQDNPFAFLEGAKWSFDRERRVGILEWAPGKTFTGRNVYESFSVTLPVKFENQKEEDSSFTVEKNIEIIVKKKLNKPEVYRVETMFQTYHKFEDGLFYTNYGAIYLNSQFYGRIFLDEEKRKELQKIENLKLYSHRVLTENFPQENIEYQVANLYRDRHIPRTTSQSAKFFPVDDLYDEKSQLIPYHLLFFIKQPLYYPRHIKRSQEICELGSVYQGKDSFCLSEINSETKVLFDSNIYIKLYSIPETLNLDNIFYKVEKKNMCGNYKNTISPPLEDEEETKTPCYFPISMISSVIKAYPQINREIYKYLSLKYFQENGNTLYKKLKDGTFQSLDVSGWDFHFYKVPDFIKWQLSGYSSIEEENPPNIILTTSERRQNVFKVYVKDYNFFRTPPALVFHKKTGDSFLWPFPYLKKWLVREATKLDPITWQLNYLLDIDLSEEGIERDSFQYFQFHFLVDSKYGVSSEPFTVKFSALPSLRVKYNEIFDSQKDVSLSGLTENKAGMKTWLSSKLSLKKKIKISILLPPSFLGDLKKFIFPKTLSLSSYFHPDKKILDYIHILETLPKCEKEKQDLQDLYEGKYCVDCSDFIEKTGERDGGGIEPSYIESVCSYKLNIYADQKTLKTSGHYFHYDYEVPSLANIRLDNTFYEANDTSDIPLGIQPEFFEPFYRRFTKKRVRNGNRIDVFFNLRPSVSPHSLSEETKEYLISYSVQPAHYNFTFHEMIPKEQKGKILQVHVSCADKIAPDYNPLCSCENPTFQANNLNVVCSFPKNQKDFSIYLYTEDPYIYFLNTVPAGIENHKRTSIEKFNIGSND